MNEAAPVVLENVEREILDKIIPEIDPFSQMSINERYFLNGVIRHFRPSRILEVGVAEGGSSAIILNAIRDRPDACLVSMDYLEKWDRERSIGWLVTEKFRDLSSNWTLYKGGDVSSFIEEAAKTMGGEIELALIDTSHIHPWETLNFLCLLPFLKTGAWVVLHDISLQVEWKGYMACRYLWAHVVTENKQTPVPDGGRIFSNIGAFQVTEDTRKYVGNLFLSLANPWGLRIKTNDLESISNLFKKYYPQYWLDFFSDTLKFQDKMDRNNRRFLSACRTFLSAVYPGMYERLRGLNRFCKGGF